MDAIFLVRHGEPTSYRDGGLTPLGRRQVRAAATALAEALARRDVSAVWMSPARRCRETARLLVEGLRHQGITAAAPREAADLVMVRTRLDDGLVDIGLARDRAHGDPVDDLDAFWRDHRDGRNPFDRWEARAYPSFEPPDVVHARLCAFFLRVAPPAIVVTHSELIRMAARSVGRDGHVGFGEWLTLTADDRPATTLGLAWATTDERGGPR